MRNDVNPKDRRTVALFTSDEILAIDIDQAVASAGLSVSINHDYDLARAELDGRMLFDVAIVDLRERDGRCREIMMALVQRGLRTVVLSGEDKMNTKCPYVSGVFAWFSKPLCVDTIIPAVVAAAVEAGADTVENVAS